MKNVVLVSLVLSIVIATVSVEGYNQTRIIGSIRWGDYLLDRSLAMKPASPRKVSVYNYKYPNFGFGKRISSIRVIDAWYNGMNGELYVNKGGVGFTSVSLSIRSKLGYGLQYYIEVWGQ